MKRIAFIDLTNFFGGGQKFLISMQSYLSAKNEYFYFVRDNKTYDLIHIGTKELILTDNFLMQIKVIRHFIKLHSINIVILNGNRPIYLAPFLPSAFSIAYKHTSNNAFKGLRKYVGVILLNLSYQFCQRVVLLYEKSRKEVLFNKQNVRIINNGVERLDIIKKSQSDITFCCVSRLDSNKGILWLIQSFHQTFPNNAKVKLLIAGDGDQYNKLKEYISINDISNIILVGFVTNISLVLSEANIFVLPSSFESFPLSVLEAMSVGLPIIATDTGGLNEMVTSNGFLVNYLDDLALKQAMLKLVNNSELMRKMGANSRNLFEQKFTIKKCVDKIQELYE